MNGPEVYGVIFSVGPEQEGRQRHLDRLRRRARARHARRRQDVDERDAEGHAGLRPREPDRRVERSAAVRRTSRCAVRCSTISRRTSSRRRDYGRTWTKIVDRAFARTTTCTPCARIPRAAACSTRRRSTACTSRTTTAPSGSRSRSTCPTCPVADLIVEGNELVIGDARSRLLGARQHRTAAAGDSPRCSPLTRTCSRRPWACARAPVRLVSWSLKTAPTRARLEILDSAGTVLRTLRARHDDAS